MALEKIVSRTRGLAFVGIALAALGAYGAKKTHDTYLKGEDVSATSVIEGNEIVTEGEGNVKGIVVQDSKRVIVRGNKVNGTNVGIYGRNISGCDLENNRLNSCATGISLNYSSNNSLSRNEIRDSSFGICLSNSPYNRVSGNSVKGGFSGIFLYGSDKNLVEDNTVEGAIFGLYLNLSNRNCIWDNSVRNSINPFTEESSLGNIIKPCDAKKAIGIENKK